MAKKSGGDDGADVIRLKTADRKGGGEAGVRDMLSQGRARNQRTRRRAETKPIGIGEGQLVDGDLVPPGAWLPDDDTGLPPGCPIGVLGKDRDEYFIVDTLRQLRIKTAEQLGQKTVQDLFGNRQDWLYWAFPGRDKSGKVVRWDNVKFHEMLAAAAHNRGIWSPIDHVRGLGMWRDDAGKLIFHAGDALYFEGEFEGASRRLKAHDPGEYGAHFYPSRTPLLPPFHEPITTANNPAGGILKDLASWNFERARIGPFLLLGAISAAVAGGALLWRPTTFMVGDRGIGKSHLNRYLLQVIGSMLRTTKNITGPAIYRLSGYDALPIAIDELEAGTDNRRVTAVIELARQAADGAKLFRTAADGSAAEFTVQGSFFFSAINAPPLGAQDFSRMIILNMRELKDQAGQAPFVSNVNIGRMLVRRIMDEWHRWPETFQAYREALHQGGHDARGQDTFGTALAMADLLLGPELMSDLGYPVDDLSPWGEWLAATDMPEMQVQQDNWLDCLTQCLSARVEAWREGSRRVVSQVLHDLETPIIGGRQNPDYLTIDQARVWLHQAGIGVTDKHKAQHGYVLAIPFKGSLVQQLFKNSIWEAAGAVGVWVSALQQGPSDVILTADSLGVPADKRANYNVVKVNGMAQRCVLVSMKGFREHTEGGQ